MDNVKSLFKRIPYQYIILNVVLVVLSTLLLVSSFSFIYLILVIVVIIVGNAIFYLLDKEKKRILLTKNYFDYLEYLSLFCFSLEEDFNKFLVINNCKNADKLNEFYNNEIQYENIKAINESVKKYKNLKYQKTLETTIKLIEEEQDKIEKDVIKDNNEKNSFLPFIIVIIFFSTFVISVISVIIGGLNV